MGFYGNITNTSRTSFSFDKVYSNRYDMDTSCGSDGIYAGRYVLVEYDSTLAPDSYTPLYYYDGQMYGSVNVVGFEDGTKFITSPMENTKVTSIAKGTVVKIPVGQKAANVNKESRYVRITSTEGDFTFITRDDYDEFLRTHYVRKDFTEETFEPGKVYIYDKKKGYILVEKYTEFVPESDLQYSGYTGTAIYAEDGLWVWVETNARGELVQRWAALGLGGTVDNDGQTTWKSWWEDNFGQYTFDLGDFEKYYIITPFEAETEYFIPYSENFIFAPINSAQEFELGIYYHHDGNDETKPLIPAIGEFNRNITYFEPGIKNDIYINDTTIGALKAFNVGDCIRVKIGHVYTTNTKYDEYWIASDITENGNITWKELAFTVDSVYFQSVGDTNYLTNFAIDAAAYGTSRGYDSTVWQKVYSSGTEKYVMVAELNSVVPTFDMSADAPSVTPITPHFDTDSTNVYYKLHWQPQWGFRTKAATNVWAGPPIEQDGTVGMAPNVTLTSDEVIYPSDTSTQWKADFYDTKKDIKSSGYYNTMTSRWDSEKGLESAEIPAAIYFNLDGFTPEKIAYSKDLLDETQDRYSRDIAKSGWKNDDTIQVSPSGKSGHLYNAHGYTLDQTAQEDVQELSVMLPSIGDTMSRLWDMVFGGRETNPIIADTNERNMDIDWENARASLDRHGLRLVNSDNREEFALDAFAKAEVNTIAGAINSAHDLMGMIITAGPEDALRARIDELDANRIYYDSTNQKYFRKHKTYDYTALEEGTEAFTYTEIPYEIAVEEFDPAGYYIIDEMTGAYVALTPDAEFDENATYYERSGEIFNPVGTLSYFDGTLFYMDYTGSKFDSNPEGNMAKMDYVKDKTYKPGHVYYAIDESKLTTITLMDGYRANKYFYIDHLGNYMLDSNQSATPGRVYYDIDPEKVVNIVIDGFNGIYKPGTYYYYDSAQKSWRLDQGMQVTVGRTYYIPSVKKTDFTEGGEGEEDKKIYREETDYQETVPPDRATYEMNVAAGKYYYSFVNEQLGITLYSLYTKSYDEYCVELPTLFLASIKYVETDEDTVTINENNPFILTGFSDGAFFFEIKDENDKVVGYKPVTIDDVNPTDPNLKYMAFVCGHIAGNLYEEWCTAICPFAIRQEWLDRRDEIEKYACKTLSDLYFPSTYHYKDKNGSYILDTYGKMTHNPYYIMNVEAISKVEGLTFYEPYKYYAKNAISDEFELVTEELDAEQIANTEFFDRKQLFVLEDTLGIYEKGAIWNPHALKEPDTVTLATREERWELKEIPEFHRNLNTMHGLLLKVNEFLEFDDTYTRDKRIANGVMNELRDTIAKFDKLIPRNFITIDDYGRFHSTDWDTIQKDSSQVLKVAPLMKDIEGDVYEEVSSLDEMRKQWLTIHLDGDPVNPLLTIHHNFQHVTDTTSEFDMNATDGHKPVEAPPTEDPGTGEEIPPVVDPETGEVIPPENPNPETGGELPEEPTTFNLRNALAAPIYVEDREANVIELYTPIVDDMGHVVGHNVHSVTLPFNFKKFNIAEQSENVTDLLPNVESLIADNTQDSFTFASGNKWIKFAGDPETDTLTIAHEVHPFTSGEPNVQYGLAVDQVLVGTDGAPEGIEEVLDDDNTFEVPNFTFDEAGHITQAETHTVTLPENFASITIEGSDNEVDNSEAGLVGVIEPDSLIDNLTFREGNRWINLLADPENDVITICHYVKNFLEATQEIDMNLVDNSGFPVQNFKWDAAGHVIESMATQYFLPFNYKTLSIKNSGTNVTDIVPGSENDLIARNHVDTATIATGNRWLTFTSDPASNTWSIYHAAAGIATPDTTKGVHAPQNPNFGMTFTVPTVGIDETGHVASLTESEVKIPLPSLTPGEGNVVTGLLLVPETGAFTEKKANVGTLELTGYELGSDYTVVKATDTLIQAFSKLQLQIRNITTFLDKQSENEATVAVTIEPNFTYQIEKPIKQVDIDFNDKDVNYYAEYRVVFTTSEAGAVISIPASYTWDGDEPPTLHAKKKYILTTDNITHIVMMSKGVSVE